MFRLLTRIWAKTTTTTIYTSRDIVLTLLGWLSENDGVCCQEADDECSEDCSHGDK